ncbi:hypothetical protein ACWDRR_33195 [Kitasatospora sp. NPDC003701]
MPAAQKNPHNPLDARLAELEAASARFTGANLGEAVAAARICRRRWDEGVPRSLFEIVAGDHPDDAVDHLAALPSLLAIPAYLQWWQAGPWLAVEDKRSKRSSALLHTDCLDNLPFGIGRRRPGSGGGREHPPAEHLPVHSPRRHRECRHGPVPHRSAPPRRPAALIRQARLFEFAPAAPPGLRRNVDGQNTTLTILLRPPQKTSSQRRTQRRPTGWSVNWSGGGPTRCVDG